MPTTNQTQNSEIYSFNGLTSEEIQTTLNSRTDFEKQSNISDATLEVLSNVAQSNNTCIVLRPVNATAFPLMKRGAVGKNMHVHGKSADTGLANGLIPNRSSISKAGKDDNAINIQKFNSENEHSLHNSTNALKEIRESLLEAHKRLSPDGNEVDPGLLLKESGVSTEKFEELVISTKLLDKKGNQIYIFENDQGLACRDEKTKDHIYAIKQGDDFIRIDENHEEIGKIKPQAGYRATEVEVLGKPDVEVKSNGSVNIKAVKPITADIDVLAYGFASSQSFEDVTTHHDTLSEAKAEIIEESGLKFDTNTRNQLMRRRVSDIKDLLSSSSEKTKPLIEALQTQEFHVDHLRGMGSGTDQTHSIVAHLREDFKDGVEISHGSEQFNLDFTQALDKEWVVIKQDGKKSVVKGEEALVEVFNEARNNGLEMHPNPNWGWKLNANNQYFIDPKYKELFNNIAQAAANVSPNAPDSIQEQMQSILKSRLELGKLAVTSKTSTNKRTIDAKIDKMTKSLKQEYEKFQKELAKPPINVAVSDPGHLKIIEIMKRFISPIVRRKSDPIRPKKSQKEIRSNSI